MHIYRVEYGENLGSSDSKWNCVYVVVPKSPADGGLLQAVTTPPGKAATNADYEGPVANADDWQLVSKQ